jgi:hypothetical protein
MKTKAITIEIKVRLCRNLCCSKRMGSSIFWLLWECCMDRGESILSEKIPAVDLSVASYISLVIYKMIHNDSSNHSLLSKFH